VSFDENILQNEDHSLQILDKNTITAFNKISEKYKLKNYTYYNSIDAFLRCAIVKNCKAFSDIPKKYISVQLCEFAVCEIDDSLEYIPTEMITLDLYKIGIYEDVSFFNRIPESSITEELCKFFLEQYENGLDYLPKKFLTEDMVNFAIVKFTIASVKNFFGK